jgi:hypothetical protein
MSSKQTAVGEPRSLQFRNQYFPGAESKVADTSKGAFIPLPIIMRKLMRHISASELRVLTYLQLRCDKFFICFPTIDEMAYELDMAGPRNLTPHIKSLEKNKFIATANGGGKKFYLVHDPRVAIAHLVETDKISPDELFEINVLLKDLKQEAIVVPAKPTNVKVPTPIRKKIA